jgi:hypothetical protein
MMEPTELNLYRPTVSSAAAVGTPSSGCGRGGGWQRRQRRGRPEACFVAHGGQHVRDAGVGDRHASAYG